MRHTRLCQAAQRRRRTNTLIAAPLSCVVMPSHYFSERRRLWLVLRATNGGRTVANGGYTLQATARSTPRRAGAATCPSDAAPRERERE